MTSSATCAHVFLIRDYTGSALYMAFGDPFAYFFRIIGSGILIESSEPVTRQTTAAFLTVTAFTAILTLEAGLGVTNFIGHISGLTHLAFFNHRGLFNDFTVLDLPFTGAAAVDSTLLALT